MLSHRPASISPWLLGIAGTLLFALPVALFLLHFPADAPFYFLAEDSFYYLSIAVHSAHVPFFSLDGLYPTNGFHPLWEGLVFALSRAPFFRLDGPSILLRLFGLNLAIVALANGLFTAFVYRLTRRPWLSLLSFSPGLIWWLAGMGAPAFLNSWADVNGMETGLEILFFSLVALLLGEQFRSGLRLWLAGVVLGLVVLSRLDDIFFLLAILAFAVATAPTTERLRRLLSFTPALLMLAAYLLYNHVTVGVWLPVSGMAKVGKGYRSGLGETLHLLAGNTFWRMPAYAISYAFGVSYTRVAQMLAPMLLAALYLGWSLRSSHAEQKPSPVLQSFAAGVLLKGAYNFVRVPLGYQGAWYYGVSLEVSNLLLALFTAEVLRRWQATTPAVTRSPVVPMLRGAIGAVALVLLSFISFNIVVSRASQNALASARDAYGERFHLAAALRSATSAPFLEFQDGELSFATGLPSESAFGLAADPAAVRAQHNGNYFDLLARRGVTVAAASGTYPAMLAQSRFDKALFRVWGFHPREIEAYCFEPFWRDPVGDIVLYHIRHQPVCPTP